MKNDLSSDEDQKPGHVPTDRRQTLQSESHSMKAQSIFSRMWKRLGLDVELLKTMFRISVAPTIAVAIYQSDTVARHFSADGYFIAMVAMSCAPVFPRSRHVRTMLGCGVGIALSTAISLLAIWCSIQARIHTTKSDDNGQKFNSSQAVVLGVWLFFTIYILSFFKAVYPQYQLAAILSGLVLCAAMTSGVGFVSMDDGISFMTILMEAFLLGVGLSLVAGLLIFPESSRGVFFKSVAKYLEALKETASSQIEFLHSVETLDPWHQADQMNNTDLFTAQKKALDGLYAVAAKMRAEQPYAEREFAYGKFTTGDIADLATNILRIMPALSGTGAIINAIVHAKDKLSSTGGASEKTKATTEWQTVMNAMHEPGAELLHAMQQAIDHILVVLELKKPVTSSVGSSCPTVGSPDFAQWYEGQIQNFSKLRETMVELWSEMGHATIPSDSSEEDEPVASVEGDEDYFENKHRRPFTIIYIHYLLSAASRELGEAVAFMDAKVADETLAKRHFISPTFQRPTKWIGWLLEIYQMGQLSVLSFAPHRRLLYRDPEHLPASNWYEHMGNKVRNIPRLLRSRDSVYALRVTLAIMTFAIGFYIRQSSAWFQRYRWLWALFTIIVAMNGDAGLATFMFLCRSAGTILAMVSAFIVYYIPNGIPAGVIVFLWVYFSITGYLLTKFPFYVSTFMVASITIVLMVANELQDKILGFANVNATGQAAYEEYIIAPLRLAIVMAGNVVAYFWTIFPYPLSEHTALRQQLGSTLYYLASHHALVSQTVTSRAQGNETMATRNRTRLAEARVRCFTKLQFLFGHLRTHLTFTKWQFMMGGKFPKEQYAEMISLCEEICTAGSVIGYASVSFIRVIEESKRQQSSVDKWMRDFQQLLSTVEVLSEEITSALVMLSNHMNSATPFPPYAHPPEAFKLAKKLDELNHGMLSIEHAAEPAYAAFVTMTMAGRGITKALSRQFEIAKELVGVLDFSSLVDVEEQALMMPETQRTA